jgi:sphingomyelin phosphodiesterase
MCTDFKIMPKDVCQGLVYSQGPVLIDAVRKASLLSGDGKFICHQGTILSSPEFSLNVAFVENDTKILRLPRSNALIAHPRTCYFLFKTIVLGSCAPQGVTSGQVSFPKAKPAFAVAPAHSGNTIDILHLSE